MGAHVALVGSKQQRNERHGGEGIMTTTFFGLDGWKERHLRVFSTPTRHRTGEARRDGAVRGRVDKEQRQRRQRPGTFERRREEGSDCLRLLALAGAVLLEKSIIPFFGSVLHEYEIPSACRFVDTCRIFWFPTADGQVCSTSSYSVQGPLR